MEALLNKKYTELNTEHIDNSKLTVMYMHLYPVDFIAKIIHKANGKTINSELPPYDLVKSAYIELNVNNTYLYICRPSKNFSMMYDKDKNPIYIRATNTYGIPTFEQYSLTHLLLILTQDIKYIQYLLHMVLKKAELEDILYIMYLPGGIKISNNDYSMFHNNDAFKHIKPDLLLVSNDGYGLKVHKFIFMAHSKVLYDALNDTKDATNEIKLPFTKGVLEMFIKGVYEQRFKIDIDELPIRELITEYIRIFDYTMVLTKDSMLNSCLKLF
ncbi:hypothetical protein F-E9_244 [Faustovirus]|nr:hypothetical protein F-E9_244 [Faustovirus]